MIERPAIGLSRVGVWLKVSQQALDESAWCAWFIFRSLPGAEKEVMAARKRLLELGWGASRHGPKGKLP